MEPTQCHGTTTKGIRCKITVKGKYCHYHQHQLQPGEKKIAKKSSTVATKEAGSVNNKPDPAGYIYVYTLSRLLNKQQDSALKVRNARNQKPTEANSWKTLGKNSSYIIIKVGLTTQTVEKRLKQWEDKCHHKLTCLYPNNKATSQIRYGSGTISSILTKFKKINLNSNGYQNFSIKDEGFYCRRNIQLIESNIHKQLRQIYGYGDVLCTGCVKKSEAVPEKKKFNIFAKRADNSSFQGPYNIHVEWFYIPKRDIERVYEIIDSVCSKYK